MKRIVLSVTNDLVTDQRVHRVATTLMEHGSHVVLVGRLLPGSQSVQREYITHRMKLLFKKNWIFYAEYNVRLFFYLLFKRVDILVSNDLDTLIANYLVSKLRRKTLVFDAHELFPEVPELVDRPFIKSIWKTIEGSIFPKLQYAYTVSHSIADIYYQKYGIKMEVVRNLPDSWQETGDDSPYPGLPAQDFVLYQGSVNKGRGLEILVDSFEYLSDIKFVIVGDGDIRDTLYQRVLNKNLQHKVILLGKLSFSELKRITPFAALGVSVEENIGLNYYCALPNKLFDYIQAEVPVLVSDFPEMKRIVQEFGVGEVLVSREPKDIADQIGRMVKQKKSGYWKAGLKKAATELCWKEEEVVMMRVYNQLL
ncbi:MAG TPA: glycosyltransferase [Bacteroidales bacterium]